MEEFIRSIPAAASSPYSLAAYAIAAIVFLIAGARLRLAKALLDRIEAIPPEDRRRAVEISTGTVLPTHINPEQWIRNNRSRWAFLLAASVLIVILVISIVAVVNPSSKGIDKLRTDINIGNQQVKLDLWRTRYQVGQVSGSAWIDINLLEGESTIGLSHWLSRVEKRYMALKSSDAPLDAVWRSSDARGDEYIEISSLTSPRKNWDLSPDGENEKFVDELLFNSHFFLLATDGEKPGLLLSPLRFDAKATSVKVYFSESTKKPNRIEGFSQGAGSFLPVPGQFSNWVDFYGAMLIARQRFLITPLPQAFKLVEYKSIIFHAEDPQWNKSATFSLHAGAELTDDFRSLIVKSADWRTLGKLPQDYPGQRLPNHGLVPERW